MTTDNHDWEPIAWWDKTTKSVRTQYQYRDEIARHLRDTGGLRFLIDEAENAYSPKPLENKGKRE